MQVGEALAPFPGGRARAGRRPARRTPDAADPWPCGTAGHDAGPEREAPESVAFIACNFKFCSKNVSDPPSMSR